MASITQQAPAGLSPTEEFRCLLSTWHTYRPRTITHLLDFWCPWRQIPRGRPFKNGEPGNLLSPGRSFSHRQAVVAFEAVDEDDALHQAALLVQSAVPKGFHLDEYEIRLLDDDQQVVEVTPWIGPSYLAIVGSES